MRRRISGAAADALVAKCRGRSVTDGVVAGCTCADLVEELGVSEEAASALRLDDAEWAASVWPLFARMAEAGLQAGVVREARAAMAGLPKTLAQLRRCSDAALRDARVPLAVRVWLRARGYASLEGGGCEAPGGAAAAAGPAPFGASARPPGAAGRHGGSADSEPAGGPAAGRFAPGGGRGGAGAGLRLGGAASAFSPR